MTKQGYIGCKRQNLGFFHVDFVPFLNFCIGVGHVTVTIKKLCDWLPVLIIF